MNTYTKHFTAPSYCNRDRFAAGDILVACPVNDPDDIIGFCVLRASKTRNTVEIEIIGVSLDAQGRGVGTLLVDAACRQRKNYGNVILMVQKDNHQALQFYQDYGFQIVSTETRDCYGLRYVIPGRGVLI